MRAFFLTSTAVLLATPSFALDNAELWDETLKQFEDIGAEVTVGSLSNIGDVLTAENVAFVFRSSNDDQPVEIDVRGVIPSWTFTDADGSVVMKMSDKISMEVETRSDGNVFSATFDIQQVNASTTIKGEIGALDYAVAADEIAVELSEIMTQGDSENSIDALSMTMANLIGTYDVDGIGTDRRTASDLRAATLTLKISGADAENGGGPVEIDMVANGLTAVSEASWPEDVSMFDANYLRSGADGSVSYGFDSTTTKITSVEDMNINMSTGATLVDVRFDSKALGYTVSMADTDMQVQGPLPIPVGGGAGLFKFGITMPIAVGGDPADYNFDFALEDLKLDDLIWSMFDPTSVLPRDPATIKVAIEGTGRWFADFFDEKAMEQAIMSGETMGELNSAKITDLQVKAAGAELTGTGDFTFDNSDKDTFPGMPRPEGNAAVTLTGGNGLLDKIVEMGLIPEDEAMGVRMGAMMFTTAGDAEDELTSTIELGDGGSLTVNGQRLR